MKYILGILVEDYPIHIMTLILFLSLWVRAMEADGFQPFAHRYGPET